MLLSGFFNTKTRTEKLDRVSLNCPVLQLVNVAGETAPPATTDNACLSNY